MYTAQELDAFLLHLFDIGAVQVAAPGHGFRFKHHEKEPGAPLAPIKFHLCTPDIRKEGILTPADVERIGWFFASYVRQHKLEVRAVAGLPRAGEPLAKTLQKELYPDDVRLLTLRKTEDQQGRRIDKLLRAQDYPRKSLVWMVDDLATRADTKLEGASVLRYEDYIVKNCMVFLVYGQRPVAELAALGIQLHYITTALAAAEVWHDNGRINRAQYDATRSYVEQTQQVAAA